MYCLSNMCYVCLEQKDKSLIDINNSLSVHKNIIHILGYLPCNLAWLKTKRIILICEECCRRLCETYQFLTLCNKNSAVLQGYMSQLSNADNEAQLRVDLNSEPDDIQWIKCEIKEEAAEIYTIESGPIIEETADVFVNVDESFVKDEDTWKREEVDNEKEPPIENNSTESSDNETHTEISVNRSTHDTDTDSDSSEATSTQGHKTNKKELNTTANKSHKCLTCSKSFISKRLLQIHTRIHTGEKPYKCGTCEKGFSQNNNLVVHMRIHTGEKPYECSRCKKSFRQKQHLVTHMRVHSGEKPFKCSRCKKCFTVRSHLLIHMPIHTGEKPYACSRCKKSFSHKQYLVYHMRSHTGEKPYKCSGCEKSFSQRTDLLRHMRIHTGEKPYECSECKKCFNRQDSLVRHMQTHTGERARIRPVTSIK